MRFAHLQIWVWARGGVSFYSAGEATQILSSSPEMQIKVMENLKSTDVINEVSLDYEPFFESLSKRGLSQNKLKMDYDVSAATLYRMKHANNMTLATAGRLMKIAGIDDLNQFVKLYIRK